MQSSSGCRRYRRRPCRYDGSVLQACWGALESACGWMVAGFPCNSGVGTHCVAYEACVTAWLVCLLQAEEDAAARISDLQSTLEVCQSDADNLRELLVQAELQCREAERQAAIATAAGGQHRYAVRPEYGLCQDGCTILNVSRFLTGRLGSQSCSAGRRSDRRQLWRGGGGGGWQAELQCREAERQAANATAAGGQHRCVLV